MKIEKENSYDLTITENYYNSILKIILIFIIGMIPFLIFMFLLANGIINKNSVRFEIVFPVYLVVFSVIIYLFLRKNSNVVKLKINKDSFESSGRGLVHFSKIDKIKTMYIKGITTFLIAYKTGRKTAFGASNGFSVKADEVLLNFIKEFEEKFYEYQNLNVIVKK